MAPYAKNTDVTVDKTEGEIKTMLRKAGAASTSFSEGPGMAMVMFDMEDRRISFKMPLPQVEDFRMMQAGARGMVERTDRQAEKVWDQACRTRWRQLKLCILAKLESVQAGIETFEDAFLAHVMMPDGKTVGEHTRETIAIAYQTGEMRPLLPPPSKGN